MHQARIPLELLRIHPQDLSSEADIGSLLTRIIHDCGHDFSITSDELQQLAQGTFRGRWSDVFFTFDEVLACYCVQTPPQEQSYLPMVFASLAVALAIRNGSGDSDFCFDKILRAFTSFRDLVEVDVRSRHLVRALGLLQDEAPAN